VSAPGASVGQSPLDVRRASLETLADVRFDVLVVGGGIVGSGVVLDAVSRGLKAALVEAGDIGSGTSSRSSRLIHGGLRYLEQFQYGLVHEALAERSRLLRLAPHLVRLEPFLFPIYGWPLAHRVFYGTGMTLYDVLGSRREGGWARHLGREATLDWTPSLRKAGLRGSIVYHDGVEDDARYTLAVARTAIAAGAVVATRTRAMSWIDEGERVRGVIVRDLLSQTEFAVRADTVVDATGVWAAQPEAALGSAGSVRPSRGAHLVVARDRIPSRCGLTIRVPGKVVFLVPWPGHWLIGTTDEAYAGRPEAVTATSADLAELLETVNRTLDVDLTRDDVLGTYAGLRPLAVDPRHSGPTVKASREHRVTRERDGLVRVSGGKFTTYRVMAADTIDAVLGPRARDLASQTAELPLVGAAPQGELDGLVTRLTDGDMPRSQAAALVRRHGTEAADIAELGRREDMTSPVSADTDLLEAEVAWAVRSELALTIDDILSRRVRVAQERPDRGGTAARRVAELLGAELGWDTARQRQEVERYLAAAHREFDVPALTELVAISDTAPEPA
jgi:glycerol-3-phosphate dehydrogenase